MLIYIKPLPNCPKQEIVQKKGEFERPEHIETTKSSVMTSNGVLTI
jgi:hypothetical protein